MGRARAAKPADPPPVTARIAADGTLVLVAAPHPGAAELWLAFRSAGPITGVTLDGHSTSLSAKPGAWTRIRWYGPDSFTVSIRSDNPNRLEIVSGELFDRWLGTRPLPPMPAADQPWDLAGSSLVIGRVAAGSR